MVQGFRKPFFFKPNGDTNIRSVITELFSWSVKSLNRHQHSESHLSPTASAANYTWWHSKTAKQSPAKVQIGANPAGNTKTTIHLHLKVLNDGPTAADYQLCVDWRGSKVGSGAASFEWSSGHFWLHLFQWYKPWNPPGALWARLLMWPEFQPLQQKNSRQAARLRPHSTSGCDELLPHHQLPSQYFHTTKHCILKPTTTRAYIRYQWQITKKTVCFCEKVSQCCVKEMEKIRLAIQ